MATNRETVIGVACLLVGLILGTVVTMPHYAFVMNEGVLWRVNLATGTVAGCGAGRCYEQREWMASK